jgi:cobalt-zinc-cadmium efflux system outer membrane protein
MERPLFAVALVLSLVPIIKAQEITEEEFLATLDEDHLAVRSLADGIARAERAGVEARTLANPRLEFWREQPDENPEVTNWTLAWTPPLDGRYGLGKKAAEAGLEAARRRLDADRALLRREFRRVFGDWSSTFERRSILREQLDLVAGLAEYERHRARAGEGSGLAARRLALAEGEVRAALGDAEAAYAHSEAAARALRQNLAPGATPAPSALPEPPAAMDAKSAPRVTALESETARADYEARRAGRYLGFPTFQLGWQTLDDGEVSDSGPILAAGWSLPLFNRDQGARIEAQRMKDVAAAQLALARSRLAGEVDGGLNAYRAQFASAQAARETAGESQAVIDAATAAFRAGEAGLTDLLDALRAAFDARLRAVDARARALESLRDLESAVGRPLTEGGNP